MSEWEEDTARQVASLTLRGNLAALPPLMMMGRVGAGRRTHPLWTKAMIHPVAEGKEGGTAASRMRLQERYASDLSPRPTRTKGLELTQANPEARIYNFPTEM